jgi:gamma-D-glutamyl-L-lysine dipeptidyl-peptidase
MDFGIAHLSIIPVRREPSHRSEMVTQLLFGELYRITGSETEWISIKLTYDDYEGWINANQLCIIPETEFIRLFDAETAVTSDLVQILDNETTHAMLPVVLGSSLPGFDGRQVVINQNRFIFEGQTANTGMLERVTSLHALAEVKRQLVDDAMLYLNTPYLWGGRSPFGIDCSGFVQMVYKLKKVKLQRDASQQALQGEVVALLAEAVPGDLAFFDNDEEVITHVGLLIDRQHIIHCSGKVRVDIVDHQGIYDETLNRYTHKLRLIKRII